MFVSHFIITRFNIPFLKKEGWERIFSEDYLDERYRIFEQYTVQSICNQSDRDFVWLVLFGSATPPKYRIRNTRLEQICPQMKAIYVSDDETDNFQSYIDNLLRSYSTNETEYIITTRIDNDDCFHRDMVSKVKEIYSTDRTERIVSLDWGIQYLDNTHIAARICYPNNHFTSFIESLDNPIKTVFYCDHFFADQYAQVQHIDCEPLWLENLHGSNAVNAVHPQYYEMHTLWSGNLHEYGLSVSYTPIQVFFSILTHFSQYLWPILSHKKGISRLKMLVKKIIKR